VRLILDAGPVVALGDRRDERRRAVREFLSTEPTLPVLSPCVAPEIDYHLQSLRGPLGNHHFLEDLAAGRFEVPVLEAADFSAIADLNRQYRDLSPGLADLSLVVLAARYRTTRLLTFDQRHFRLIRPLQGGVFTLLPFDEDIE
jgi:predicted nucleic acid-binding protein